VSRVADDRRFAEAAYKVALAGGVMERVAFLDSRDDTWSAGFRPASCEIVIRAYLVAGAP